MPPPSFRARASSAKRPRRGDRPPKNKRPQKGWMKIGGVIPNKSPSIRDTFIPAFEASDKKGVEGFGLSLGLRECRVQGV